MMGLCAESGWRTFWGSVRHDVGLRGAEGERNKRGGERAHAWEAGVEKVRAIACV